jgi:glycosyltransferase involved in cell wall biosynthesis
MAYARPIIGGARDAAPEILGDAALLVDPENVEQVGDAMIRLLSEPDLQGRLGAAGQKRLTSYFTFDHFRSRLLSSLERSLRC